MFVWFLLGLLLAGIALLIAGSATVGLALCAASAVLSFAFALMLIVGLLVAIYEDERRWRK